MSQIHNRKVFRPIDVQQFNERERKRAMESLIFFTEKRDKSVKTRMCASGSTQRSYISREEASSSTADTESILITGVIEAKQQRDIM